MLMIECPWCGPRDEIEFAYGGEAARPRPADPAVLDDDKWAAHLFMRRNPKGDHLERWSHAAGCRQWFNVCRNTVTHAMTPAPGTTAVAATAPVARPAIDGEGSAS